MISASPATYRIKISSISFENYIFNFPEWNVVFFAHQRLGKKHDVYTSFEEGIHVPPSFFLLFFGVEKVWGKVSFEVVSSPHNEFPSFWSPHNPTTLFPKPSRYIHTFQQLLWPYCNIIATYYSTTTCIAIAIILLHVLIAGCNHVCMYVVM